MSESTQNQTSSTPCPFQADRDKAASEREKSPQEKSAERAADFEHWASMQSL